MINFTKVKSKEKIKRVRWIHTDSFVRFLRCQHLKYSALSSAPYKRCDSSLKRFWSRAVQSRSALNLSASCVVKPFKETLPCLMLTMSLLISFSTKDLRPPSSSNSSFNSTIFFLGRLFPAHWASLFQNSTSSFKFLAIIFGFLFILCGFVTCKKKSFKINKYVKKSIIIFDFFYILQECNHIL